MTESQRSSDKQWRDMISNSYTERERERERMKERFRKAIREG